MNIILPAVRDALDNTITCFVAPDSVWRPDGVDGPCIGVMSGGITREELGGNMREEIATVELVAYVPLVDSAESSISSLQALLNSASSILTGNLLSVAGMQSVQIGSDRANGVHQLANNKKLVSYIRQIIYTLERSSI